MADLTDVETALVAVAVQALYPLGTGQPSSAGAPVRVYAGWPTSATLDPDLAAGVSHVTVFPSAGERNTTRFPREWKTLSINTPTLFIQMAGQVVTLSGSVPAAGNPHNICIMVGGKPYVYAVQTTDTLPGIAAALSGLIAAAVPGTTSAGGAVTLPSGANLQAARIGIAGTSIRELRRQERAMQIIVWASTPAIRDAAAQAVDALLATTDRITLTDGSSARVIYAGTRKDDQAQKAALYRRDLTYKIEYATTQTETDYQIVAEQLNVGYSPDLATLLAPATTIYS